MEELYILGKKKMLRRVFIFWDHVIMFNVLQELNIRIDYNLVKSRLARGYNLVAPVMYLGSQRVVFPKNQKFFDALIKQGWFIIETPLKIHSSRRRKQGAESTSGVEDIMFLDMCDFTKEGAYEKAIIVSGDSTFVSVVKELKELDIDIEVWSFRISISQALIKEVGSNHVHYFDDFMEDITLMDYSNNE